MSSLTDLFMSPEWYPLKMDFERRQITFVRMSPAAYRESTFHAARAAQRFGRDHFEMRLDDVLLAAADAPAATAPIHFILHCGLCCSTLLTRYLDLFPDSVVIKEPHWLTQMALARNRGIPGWREIFDLSVRLLTRTYRPGEIATIKTNIPCNPLGAEFLERNERATLTFLMASIKDFMLAVLKSDYRRRLVRTWNRDLSDNPTGYPLPLANVPADRLTDEQTAACYWVRARSLCTRLAAGPHRSRVLVLDGQRIADSPREILSMLASMRGRALTEGELSRLIDHPSVHQHSKNTSRPYNAESRRKELEDLRSRYAEPIDAAIDWAISSGASPDWMTIPETHSAIAALR